MGLGVTTKNQNWKEALATGIIIFFINFLNALPEAGLPTPLDLYVAVRGAAITALVIYALNKGIAWKRAQE